MREIPLTRGLVALVDDADYPILSAYKWYASSHPYAARRIYLGVDNPSPVIYMHRALMNPPKGMQIDHIDRNRLNNQRANLRLCNRSQNQANQRPRANPKTSQYRGVSASAARPGKWSAFCAGRPLGRFDSEIEAAKAYDAKAREVFAEFALFNFPSAADMKAATRAVARACHASYLAEYRAQHHDCKLSDAGLRALLEIHAMGRR